MLLSLIAVVCGPGGLGSATAGASPAPTVDGAGWTVYHHDPAGRGVAAGVTSVTAGSRAWTSPVLDGSLYGEPLVFGGTVYVATENDVVYALAASSGAVVWSRHLGPAVPASVLPCGDITPTVGITGTPVIDPSRGELYVVADELIAGSPSHRLVGLSLTTGAIEMSQAVDPAGASPASLLQRTGLTLDGGRIVLTFGGNYGDCGTYRGWVVAVGETGGTPLEYAVDAARGESQGAVWMGGGAPAVDAEGDLWVSTGNGSVTSTAKPYDDSDSVLELSPSLGLEQFFAPANWASNNAADLDLSTVPALLTDGQVVAAGKTRLAYLLDGAHLGGIGGQVATVGPVCGDDVDGGSTTVDTTVYLPCLDGIVALRVGAAPPSLRVVWSSRTGGGPPILAGGLVWTISQAGVLYGLDPATGAVRQQALVGKPANHFPTPSAGDGILMATSSDQVVAFATSSDLPAAAPGAGPTTGHRAPGGPGRPPSVVTGSGGVTILLVLAGVAGGLLVTVAVGSVELRRRSRRRG